MAGRLGIAAAAVLVTGVVLQLAFAAPVAPGPLRVTIMVSTSVDRAQAKPLRGRAPFGTLYPFLKVSGDGAIASVRYALDGKRISTSRRAPYPARALRPTELSHGPHVLEAEVAVKGADRRVVRASFSSVRLFAAPAGIGTTCTSASPCGSLERAYTAAAPGQVVEIAPGDYGAQSIAGTKAAPGVTFQLRSGDAAARLELHATYLTFEGPMRLGWRAFPDAQHVTFRNVRHEGFFGIWSADHISLLGGESYCPETGHYCDYDPQITEDSGNRDPPSDILIDGVHFHDWGRPPGSDWHTECLQGGAGTRVTIRNSRFERCATHGVFVRSWGGINGGVHALRDWTFENNFFDKSAEGYYAVQFIGDLTPECETVSFRYNTARESFRTEACRDIHYVGNLAPRFSFQDCAGTFAYNVWYAPGGRPAKCSATDKRVTEPGLMSATGMDLRLRTTSRAVDAGDPKDFPRRDIQGERRPKGRAPDAGADEVR